MICCLGIVFSEIRRSKCALLDIMEIIVESFARILLLGIIAKRYANAIRTCVITYMDARPQVTTMTASISGSALCYIIILNIFNTFMCTCTYYVTHSGVITSLSFQMYLFTPSPLTRIYMYSIFIEIILLNNLNAPVF